MRRYNLRRAPQGHTILHWGFASDCSDDRQPGGGYVYACLHQGEECVAVVRPCGRQLGNSSWRLETLACDSDTPLLRDLHLTNLDLPNLTDEQAFELMQRFEAHFSGLMELQNVVSLAAP